MSIRTRFDAQLDVLNQGLIDMARSVEQAITMVTTALVNKDIPLAEQVITIEERIDEWEKDIESMCLKLMTHQQPIARDLRIIQAALKMITDMERISDQASDISEICLLIKDEPYILPMDLIQQMGETSAKMVRDSTAAFVNKNTALAMSVVDCDDIVDDLFAKMKDKLYDLMVADVQNGRQALDLLMIAKYYERIADHAENIAEWVIFSITGDSKHSKT